MIVPLPAQISDQSLVDIYLLWALGDTEPRDGLQLVQSAPCVPQATAADHWHLWPSQGVSTPASLSSHKAPSPSWLGLSWNLKVFAGQFRWVSFLGGGEWDRGWCPALGTEGER